MNRIMKYLCIICICAVMVGCGNTSKKEICSLSDCDNQVYKDGLCTDHYVDAKLGKKVNEEVEQQVNLYGEKMLTEIKSDFEQELIKDAELSCCGEYTSVSDVSLIKRDTNEKRDDVYCKFSLDSDFHYVVKEFHLIYNFYTTGGWILDEIISESEGLCYPKEGPPSDVIAYAMYDLGIISDNYTVNDIRTDIDVGTSDVDVSVNLSESVMEIKGNIVLKFVFDKKNGYWKFISSDKDINDITNMKYAGTYVSLYAEGTFINAYRYKLHVKEFYQENGAWYENFWEVIIENNVFYSASTDTPNTTHTRMEIFLNDHDKQFVTSHGIVYAEFYSDGMKWSPWGAMEYYTKLSDDILTPKECAVAWLNSRK